MQEEVEKLGSIIVGYGTSQQREVEIANYLQANFKDHRLISVMQLVDNSYVVGVENPESTGRGTKSTIWLSQESLIGVLTTSILYFTKKGVDLEKILKEAVSSKETIDFIHSGNLK